MPIFFFFLFSFFSLTQIPHVPSRPIRPFFANGYEPALEPNSFQPRMDPSRLGVEFFLPYPLSSALFVVFFLVDAMKCFQARSQTGSGLIDVATGFSTVKYDSAPSPDSLGTPRQPKWSAALLG